MKQNRSSLTQPFKWMLICLALIGSGLGHAQNRELYENYRLNPPLPASVDVANYRISPNGQRVVYITNNLFGISELYSVSIRGGAVVTLNQALGTFDDIAQFVISPDGQWVVYQIIKTDGTGELWSIAISGAGARVLEHFDFAGADASGKFAVSKKNYLAYEEFGVVTGGLRIRGNPLRGNTGFHTIAVGNHPNTSYSRMGFSKNGDVFLYLADKDIDDKFELYGAYILESVFGQAPQSFGKVNGPINDSGDVNSNYKISLDGTRVIYSANQFGGPGDNSLFSADLTGASGAELILSISSAPQKLGAFQITPDSQKVIFEARLSLDASEEVYNYYSFPIAGGTRTQLTPWSAGNVVRDFAFDISTDSKYLVIANNRFGPDSNPDGGVYRIDIDIGFMSTLKLNDNALPGSGSNYPSSASITPDGKTVIYSTSNSGQQSIYAMPIDRFVPNNGVLLHNNPFTTSEVVASSANSEQVIYRQKLLGSSTFDPFTAIFVNDTKGGNPHHLINKIPINTTMSNRAPLNITQNGEFAVYLGVATPGVQELFAVRIREADDEFCVPIRAQNGKIAVICL